MEKVLSTKEIEAFRREVYAYYGVHGRRLPWRRKATTAYQIYVSEVMLQQTQVERVVEKFLAFTRAFKNFQQLAAAPFSEVLKVWQGLGYNRRALFLHTSAQKIVAEFNGRLPRTTEQLEALPGIGKATAASIAAFAFNLPTVFIETNIRSVFIHHFFHDETDVSDEMILPLVAVTVDQENAHRWYSALMDYGVSLKQQYGNPSRKSKHHVRQSRFEGSDRQLRGAIVRLLTEQDRCTFKAISTYFKDTEKERLAGIIDKLIGEGILRKRGSRLMIR